MWFYFKGNPIRTILFPYTILGECNTCNAARNGACSHQNNGACFYLECGNYSWYEARSRCDQLNMHLAVSIMESNKDLLTWIDDKPCENVWLGYSKEDWYYSTPTKG